MILFLFKDIPFLYNTSGSKLKTLCFYLDSTNDFPKLLFSLFFLLSFDFGLSFFFLESCYLSIFVNKTNELKLKSFAISHNLVDYQISFSMNYKISLLVVISKDSIVIICNIDLKKFAFKVIVNLTKKISIEQLQFLINLVDIVDVFFLYYKTI